MVSFVEQGNPKTESQFGYELTRQFSLVPGDRSLRPADAFQLPGLEQSILEKPKLGSIGSRKRAMDCVSQSDLKVLKARIQRFAQPDVPDITQQPVEFALVGIGAAGEPIGHEPLDRQAFHKLFEVTLSALASHIVVACFFYEPCLYLSCRP
jgi:hypothetical protein